MTTSAGQRQVGITQCEVGQVVGEAGLVESRDVRVTPVVLRVATATLPGARGQHAAVVTGFAANVLRNFLVAAQTERGLTLTIGSVMAGGTILLDPGVRLGDWARHDQCLEGSGVQPVGTQRD